MRKIYEIASDIKSEWAKPYFGAVPYLEAMFSLADINDHYGLDPAREIINYFLANANSFRGEKARNLKIELKNLLKQNRK